MLRNYLDLLKNTITILSTLQSKSFYKPPNLSNKSQQHQNPLPPSPPPPTTTRKCSQIRTIKRSFPPFFPIPDELATNRRNTASSPNLIRRSSATLLRTRAAELIPASSVLPSRGGRRRASSP